MSTTALQIITDAYAIPNVFMAGDPIPGPDGAQAFRFLNNMVGQFGLQNTVCPGMAIYTFPLTAFRGGPPTPVAPVLSAYTIGPGGDFNVPRPPSQSSITGCGLLLGAISNLPVEVINRAVYTNDEYQAIAIKNLTNSQFTGMWYNDNFVNGRGSISLWPVPDNSLYSIVLYVNSTFPLFVNLTTAYDLPLGYDEAFIYNLAVRLAGLNGRSLLPEDVAIARASMRRVKDSNFPMTTLAADPMLVQSNRRSWYNINSGQGGGAN